jgi:hypothetical protein
MRPSLAPASLPELAVLDELARCAPMAAGLNARHSRSRADANPTPQTVAEGAAARGRGARLRGGPAQADGRQAQAATAAARARRVRQLQRAASGARAAGSLIEGAEPLDESPRPRPPKARCCRMQPTRQHAVIDRSLPAHLPRENQVHRPEATPAHHDATASPAAARPVAAGCARSAGRLRATGVRAGPLQGDPPRAPQAGLRGCQTIFQAARPAARSRAAWPGRRCWRM